MAEIRKPRATKAKTRTASSRKSNAKAAATRRAAGKPSPRPQAKARKPSRERPSTFDITKLMDHPLVADLLAVGAMAAVAAIADHNVKTRTGETEAGSSKAVKAAGKAAATAIGKRLMTEVNAVRKTSKPTETKRGSK